MSARDLTGQRYGRLLVIRRAPHPPKKTKWECLCDCGKTVITRTSYLTLGETRSCGCLKRERFGTGVPLRRHGDAFVGKVTSEYRIWQNAKSRCHVPSCPAYPYYGARGIQMCERWRNDYAAFLADMGRRPVGHSLERRDNDGPYSPENCYWATRTQQNNNTRASRRLEFRGQVHTVAQWARLTGLHSRTIRARLDVNGWTIERTLTTPVR